MNSLFSLLSLALLAGTAVAGPPAPDWAFQAPVLPAIPGKQNAGSIDAFLLEKLAREQLCFAPAADRRTWIRRVTIDLTGLPPTIAEIDAFVADPSPRAFEIVVDRLLASPRFGERAALFWLDVVRYAESDGFKSDDYRPTAWRYRDYVIASFNADKPYDRFVKEQLAGDELSPGDPSALIATGFLRHASYEYNAVNVELRRQEWLNDMTDTTAAAFLGLTFGCAKCHDHKTDPITQEDYYRLQAFFAGYAAIDAPLATPAERAARADKLAAWEAKTAELRAKIEAIEKSYREKAEAKERSRFPDEYARVIDIPLARRTPYEKQIGYMVEKQVYSGKRFAATQLKAAEKEQWTALQKQLAEFEKDKPTELPTAQAMTDVGPAAAPTRLLKRGSILKPGAVLNPAFPGSLTEQEPTIRPTATTTGRRTALAQWIASKDNPLTARVFVNRVWQQLFGRGIVATAGDFGATGDRPTHPELLDWLAIEFAKTWSMKSVYRAIVLSQAYRQSGVADHGRNVDPENALLWRMPRKRLDGEALRDALLATSGNLNLKMGGPAIYPDLPDELKKTSPNWKPSDDVSERNRRSVYVAVRRNLRYPLFSLFDSPDRVDVCARRFVTTTAPQALTLVNDTSVLGIAKHFAGRVTTTADEDPDAIVGRAFTLAIGRAPDTEERTAMSAFLTRHAGPRAEAIADLCHAILNLNEFLYID